MESRSIAVGGPASRAPGGLPATVAKTSPYFNRELSWLAFNRRVLDEALDDRHPLLERVKFLAIFSANLDEFFMIRVAGLMQQVAAGVLTRSPDGLMPAEQLTAIQHLVNAHKDIQRNCWLHDLQPKLRSQGICVLDYAELTTEQRASCKAYFEREVFPVLTPLAFDPSHPFPHISNLSINLAVVINDPDEGELFARVKVPAVLPRLIALDGGCCDEPGHRPPERCHCFVWLEQVIAAHIDALFPGMAVVESYAFRITRNADLEIQEEEAADLLRTIEQRVRARRFGAVVRLTVQRAMPRRIRNLLLTNLGLTSMGLYEVMGPLELADLMALTTIDRPDLEDAPLTPATPPALRNAYSCAEIFAAIRAQDILVRNPYDIIPADPRSDRGSRRG